MKGNNLPPKAPAETERRYLLGSLFVTGAAALVLEIVGTRVISPYYGSSLYCWSALITVTMIALAGGYNFGGRLADRDPSVVLFSRLVTAAALAVAVVPVLRNPVLRLTAPLGVQLGALASGTMLMAPALFLLGALNPVAIRLTTQAVATVGKSAGDAYSVSTLGSVLGAVLAGFVLVPHLGISRLLYGTSIVLLLLGALGSWLSASRLPARELVAAAAAALIGFWPRQEARTNVVMNKESYYGQIKVLDFGNRRYLLVNGTTQSMADTATLETDSQYAHVMEWAAASRPEARRALVIGVGAGLLPKAIERHYGMPVDAVDIDPEIVAAAKTYFAYNPRGEVSLQDGRIFLESPGPRYGLIFLDAFASDSPPYHLFTQEAFQTMKKRLEPGGILAVNMVTIVRGAGNQTWKSLYRTLGSVFPHVRIFQASDTYEDLGNVILFCSEGPLDGPKKVRPGIQTDVALMLGRELTAQAALADDGLLMTDDHAPLEFLIAKTAARWRSQLQRKISDIMLY